MECFDDRFLVKLVAGTLPGAARQSAASHIDRCMACRDLVAEAAIATTEQSVPGYRVAGEVARGAMGRIVAAHDLRLGREVALKQLIEPTPGLRRRFEREVTITAALQHPGIVPVYQAGELANGEPFYAMRRVHGRALDIVIAEATTVEQRLALVPRVLGAIEAVAYAHSQHVIHRDLKPQNILVGEFGETVVVDWGLAKRLDEPDEIAEERNAEQPELTRDGAVLGTPAYMAPEQAAAAETDTRADVYALGAVLYHTLSGEAPHRGSSLTTTLEKVREGCVERLGARAVGVPADLVAIVDRAMASDPAARYADAAALAEDLRGFLAGKLVGAHEYTRWQLVKRWVARHRAWVAAAALLVVGLGAIGAFSFTSIRAERDTAARERDTVKVERNAAEQVVIYAIKDVYEALNASGQHDAMDRLGKRLVEYYDHVLAVRPNDKYSRAYRAMALDMQANAAFRLGDMRRAEQIWLEALPPMREARTVDSSAALDVGLAQYNLANIARLRGDTANAEKYYRAAIGDLEPEFVKQPALLGSALAGSLDGITQVKMTALDPRGARPTAERALEVAQAAVAAAKQEDPQLPQRLAQVAFSLANLEALEGRRTETRRLLELGIATLSKLQDDPVSITAQGYQRFSLSLVELSEGKLDTAAQQIAQAQKLVTTIRDAGFADPQVIRLDAMLHLVDAQRLLAAHKHAEAVAAAGRALSGLAALRDKHPEVMQYGRDHAQALATQARALALAGRTDEAIASASSAVNELSAIARYPSSKHDLAYASIVAAEVGGPRADERLASASSLLDAVGSTAKAPIAHARAYIAAVRVHRDPKALDAYRAARAELVKATPLSMPPLVELDRIARH